MKRTQALPLLLLGLCMTAKAAAQDATTAPQDPSAPPPASADPSAPSSTPAVSAGTPAAPPSNDTPPAAPSTPAARPKPRPFAGSSIALYNSVTTGTIFRGQQQDYNPTVESTLWLLPRYALSEALQLRARMLVNYEYTNSDATTYRNEPLLTDTTLQLFYRKIPRVGGFQPFVGINVALPTSKVSRARTMLFTPGATVQLARPFEHVLGGELMVIASVVYSHPFYRSPNAEVIDPRQPAALQCLGSNCTDMLSGTMNVSDTLTYALIVTGEWGKWSPGLMYFGGHQWTYTPSEVTNPIDGTPIGRPEGFEPTSVRQTHYFSALLDYNFNAWLTAEVGYWNSTSVLGEDGRFANPFFNRYQDSRFYGGVSIQIDNLVQQVQGGSEGEAGVVRAKNTKTPMWRF